MIEEDFVEDGETELSSFSPSQQPSNSSSEDALKKIEEQFDDLFVTEQSAHIDINMLDTRKIATSIDKASKWRKGPVEISSGAGKTKKSKVALLQAETTVDDETVDEEVEEPRSKEELDRALLNYFAYLGTTDEEAIVDYDFLEHTLEKADANVRDKYGQTIMHEVAREWNTDLALFLQLKGANIDLPDNWGRTPLYVAVSSNHTAMVQWLVENGADINHRTGMDEEQLPIHYAAKSQAIDAFQKLIELGADPMSLDKRKRSPLYLAAEQGHQDICYYMLEMGLPVCTYNVSGIATIDQIIEKLPSTLATMALDQYIVDEGRYASYYVNCLEKKRWKLLTATVCDYSDEPMSVLKILINQENLSLITHPVILKLLEVRSRFYGRLVNQNILWHFVYTVLWTLASTLHVTEHSSLARIEFVLILSSFGTVLTVLFVIKLILEWWATSQELRNNCIVKNRELEHELKACHPTWPLELINLEKRKMRDDGGSGFFSNGWNCIEALCLLLSLVLTALTGMVNSNPLNASVISVRTYLSAFFVVIVWLRLNRSLGHVQWFGPFIAMLGECVFATARFAFLYVEFFVPFACGFWVLFGNVRTGVDNADYETFNDLVYQLFLLTFVGSYSYNPLRDINKTFAQLFVSVYIILVSVVSFNLYIALLSEAFARINDAASATAYLKEAVQYNTLGNMLQKREEKFQRYLNAKCAPLHTAMPEIPRDISSKAAILFIGKLLDKHSKELKQLETDVTNSALECIAATDTLQTFHKNHDEKVKGIPSRFTSLMGYQSAGMMRAERKARTLAKMVTASTSKRIAEFLSRAEQS